MEQFNIDICSIIFAKIPDGYLCQLYIYSQISKITMTSILTSEVFWRERVQILIGKNIKNFGNTHPKKICWKNVYNILLRYIDDPNTNEIKLDYNKTDCENSMYILNKYGCERKDTYVNISNMLSKSNYLKNIENILNSNKDFCIFNNTTL